MLIFRKKLLHIRKSFLVVVYDGEEGVEEDAVVDVQDATSVVALGRQVLERPQRGTSLRLDEKNERINHAENYQVETTYKETNVPC